MARYISCYFFYKKINEIIMVERVILIKRKELNKILLTFKNRYCILYLLKTKEYFFKAKEI